jgi:hypothetical protein
MQKKRSSASKFREDYLHLLSQLEIMDVRVVSAKIDNFASSGPVHDCSISVRTRPSYENAHGRIDMFHRYNLTVSAPEVGHPLAKLLVVFCVSYSSQIPMTDEAFAVFKEHSLPLTTWPYFREFVHNMFTRLGWIRLIPPAFKRGVPSPKKKQNDRDKQK